MRANTFKTFLLLGVWSAILIDAGGAVARGAQLGISRSREHMADELGARLAGDPESLARALERLPQGAAVIPTEAAQPATASLFIVNPFSGAGGFSQLFSTHPPIEARVARLRALARAPRHLAA